jgi:hypothetical protein
MCSIPRPHGAGPHNCRVGQFAGTAGRRDAARQVARHGDHLRAAGSGKSALAVRAATVVRTRGDLGASRPGGIFVPGRRAPARRRSDAATRVGGASNPQMIARNCRAIVGFRRRQPATPGHLSHSRGAKQQLPRTCRFPEARDSDSRVPVVILVLLGAPASSYRGRRADLGHFATADGRKLSTIRSVHAAAPVRRRAGGQRRRTRQVCLEAARLRRPLQHPFQVCGRRLGVEILVLARP